MNNMFDTTEVREVLEYLGDLKHYYKVSFMGFLNDHRLSKSSVHFLELLSAKINLRMF